MIRHNLPQRQIYEYDHPLIQVLLFLLWTIFFISILWKFHYFNLCQYVYGDGERAIIEQTTRNDKTKEEDNAMDDDDIESIILPFLTNYFIIFLSFVWCLSAAAAVSFVLRRRRNRSSCNLLFYKEHTNKNCFIYIFLWAIKSNWL